MERRSVVITAIGMVTALGDTAAATFEALVDGRCGVGRHPQEDIDHPVGFVRADISAGLHPSQVRAMDRVTVMAQHAATEALQQAALNTQQQSCCGVFFGTGIGGVSILCEGVEAYYGIVPKRPVLIVPATMPNASAAYLAQQLKSQQEAQTYGTACSAGAVAIGEAFRRIRDGYLDVAIAGGAEAMLTPVVFSGWKQLHVLATPAEGQGVCRPFSLGRTGIALAEGAAWLMLESAEHAAARGAQPLAELCGYGVSNDGTHPLRPDPQGQALAMSRCLADAGLAPEAVGYLNAHATGTLVGDRIETAAIRQVFGAHAEQLPVSSIKGALGHAIGAAGAIEAAVTALAVQRGVVPPTLFFEPGDEQCNLDYISEGGRALPSLNIALSNAFGMGGNNAVLAFRKAG
ncbi:beta-ketoacyl-[acyl-carrier-protein] synthase family protein [Bordetella avium]|uniref:3-oxoacyl-[acyl-carrier-protein] synthase n=1 Tax=Bordetella avium (strain 197N) TaxID=360910 RepID=Q2L100_BORA1|nr:beta-ketoacyl-[acyl-carrier-protein] synthase family protein [Bordetella avium]AZY52499.1 beta-ketoacyl-[acyl-carrier-protein] synthase family protein [Bordetella avium]RIQ48549.1 beta-ketoacyl-[acyl-carrier-protein] synthase family protein [Bordetella avium]RIQ71305.1 beta-ketoacyl-[acyl-carrier-protein] synthase family protein [Bordetella avium]CAJ49379.1 3-oxoacyl-[acyl-carrier-protein] synthase [Bordetella avium 197N]